jgi:hypothetical protein
MHHLALFIGYSVIGFAFMLGYEWIAQKLFPKYKQSPYEASRGTYHRVR